MRPKHAGTFHVCARSINEEWIFRDDRDYLAALQILAELVREQLLRCHAFCLMPTHYHLLAWFDDNMLETAIHRLNRRYAGGFNRRHGRRGHVFDSPYVSVEVTRDEHALDLPTYISENPPFRPWPWSSYDNEFSFVSAAPWLDTREPGSAAPNQVR
jgi:REP element-mobilizing transposase RayT